MARTSQHLPGFRWILVVVCAGVMGVAGSYQFIWSSFSVALEERIATSEPELASAFTLFVIFQVVVQFPGGWVRDRYGPRLPMLVSAVFLTSGYVSLALAENVTTVYLAYTLGGIGGGLAYTVAVNTPVKWFDDWSGLTTGIVTMAFGATSFLLIPFVRTYLESSFGATMLSLAMGAGVISLVAAIVINDPNFGNDHSDKTGDKFDKEGRELETEPLKRARNIENAVSWRESILTWQFWLLFGVFTIINGVGLMIISKAIAYANAMNLSTSIATAVASIIAVTDALGVIAGGAAGDRLGLERTLAAALVLSGLALGGAVISATLGSSIQFVVFIAFAVFLRSPAFAIYPALIAKYYGVAFSSENYALIYSGKLFGGVFAGIGASTVIQYIGWTPTVALGALLLVIAGTALSRIKDPRAPR